MSEDQKETQIGVDEPPVVPKEDEIDDIKDEKSQPVKEEKKRNFDKTFEQDVGSFITLISTRSSVLTIVASTQ
jgi:hypothetical protein